MGYSPRKKAKRPVRAKAGAGSGRSAQGLGADFLVLLGMWLAGVLFINAGGPQRYVGLAEGQRAPATVVAAVDFECVDLAATELLRRQAGEKAVPVFAVQAGPLQAAARSLGKLADHAVEPRRQQALPGGEGGDIGAGLATAADFLGITVEGEDLEKVFAPGKEMEALGALKETLAAVWWGGVLAESDRSEGMLGVAQGTKFDLAEAGETGGEPKYHLVAPEELPSPEMAAKRVAAAAAAKLEPLGIEAPAGAIEGLARPWLRPNLTYDERATQERRTALTRQVEPVRTTVRAGTTLMEERTTVDAQTVETINAYNRRMAELETPRDRRTKQAGDAALMMIVLLVCVGWLHASQPGAYRKARRKWQLVLLGLLAIAFESLYHSLSVGLNWIPPWVVPFAMPITLPTMLAALMLGPSAALATGLWSSLSAALMFDRNFELMLLGLGGSVMAVVLLRGVRKRSQAMRAGFAVGLLKGLMALALAAMYQHLPSTFLIQVAAGVLSGCFAALLALLLLPAMEWLFRHTTDISMLELADMSHPLLQRLALEAPGTYHHSLMVGAIGQAAANRIGANGLLVSVCAHFHDVGKLAKPEFFTENQRGGENPHDNLAPSMSALVIQSHVKEGVTLAKRHKLPRPICEGIASHHGTTLTSYFYQVARRSLKEAGMAEDSGLEHRFRYEGPKPHTRELAILMLADTVEAASRSIEKPTPNRIAEMVETLTREKLLDGQLDHCPLTLEDLRAIQESFAFSLTNILHGRNPYPREDQPAQPAAGAADTPGGISAPGEDVRAPGGAA